MKTQGEDSHTQAKERGLRKNQPCGYFNLGLKASKTEKFLLLTSLVCGICYSSLSRLTHILEHNPLGATCLLPRVKVWRIGLLC